MPAEPAAPLHFATQRAWRTWLHKNHAKSAGEWLRFAKAGSEHRSVKYKEAVETALCYGWIDGVRKRLDDDFFIQRFTRRRSTSVWSRINRDAALDLIERGLMEPAGLAVIEQAKSTGRWDAAYDPSSKAVVPPDLQAGLEAHAGQRRPHALASSA